MNASFRRSESNVSECFPRESAASCHQTPPKLTVHTADVFRLEQPNEPQRTKTKKFRSCIQFYITTARILAANAVHSIWFTLESGLENKVQR